MSKSKFTAIIDAIVILIPKVVASRFEKSKIYFPSMGNHGIAEQYSVKDPYCKIADRTLTAGIHQLISGFLRDAYNREDTDLFNAVIRSKDLLRNIYEPTDDYIEERNKLIEELKNSESATIKGLPQTSDLPTDDYALILDFIVITLSTHYIRKPTTNKLPQPQFHIYLAGHLTEVFGFLGLSNQQIQNIYSEHIHEESSTRIVKPKGNETTKEVTAEVTIVKDKKKPERKSKKKEPEEEPEEEESVPEISIDDVDF
ncbi:MAG: hypothetical protein CMM93_06790 [Rickettsiales bacterium]|nr:hypothetical protein [Rickettsiales bacterium]|tara:strand:- start:1575 stop:2345 length:771 start_codon:yes stop_codon:yes gene_type:complete